MLAGIARASHAITLRPERRPLLPQKADANAHADAEDPDKAARKGGLSESGTVGVGGGSSVSLAFTAQDWDRSSRTASLRARDETLLHELIHALRQVCGLEDSFAVKAPFEVLRRGEGSVMELMSGQTAKPGPYSQIYNDYEEFVAITITNVYRSENGRQGLRRDHLGGDGQLVYPLSNPRNFMSTWRPLLSRCSRCGKYAIGLRAFPARSIRSSSSTTRKSGFCRARGRRWKADPRWRGRLAFVGSSGRDPS